MEVERPRMPQASSPLGMEVGAAFYGVARYQLVCRQQLLNHQAASHKGKVTSRQVDRSSAGRLIYDCRPLAEAPILAK